MKLWYRFVCIFVAVVVVLFSFRVPDVDAEEFIFCDVSESAYNDMSPDFINYIDNIVVTDDMINFYNDWKNFSSYSDQVDLFAVFFTSNEIVTITHGYPDNFSYVDKDTLVYGSDYNNNILNYFCYGDTNITKYNLDYDYIRGQRIFNSRLISIDFNNNIFSWNNDSDYTGTFVSCYVYPFNYDSSSLTFTINPELSDSMDMNNLNTNFTIDVENETDNAYNYCIYISSQPASVGIVNSLQSANYFLSSKQWCYVFQQDYQLDADLIDQIKNNVSDNYTTTDILDYMLKGAPITNLTNVWGGVYDGAKEYIALKNNSMSFYSLVQTNCPVYLIRSNSTRSHVVDYASLNVNLDTQYYLNIIYYQPDMNVVGAIGSSTAALVSAATGEDMIYPIYNVDFFRDYTVYDSIPFSFVNGTFSISEDDVTKYNDVVQNSNPANSTANISSDDDNVNINNSNSYDSSVKTNYYNYGTIYHNCSWSGSGGSSSGARPSVPDLPDAEFEDLYEQSGNFFDFVSDVLDAVGAVPALFIAAAFAVLLFLRIWGR